ncbi:hypothetical protein E2320_008722, partial [Naja naja]
MGRDAIMSWSSQLSAIKASCLSDKNTSVSFT